MIRTATILDLVPDCQYQLHGYGDAGGDGWGNSYIGVYQNGINSWYIYNWDLEVYQDYVFINTRCR